MQRFKIICIILFFVSGVSARAQMPVVSVPYDSIPFEIGADHKIYVNATVNSDTVPLIEANKLQGKQKPWGISTIVGLEGADGKIEEVTADMVKLGDYILYQIPVGLNLTNSGAAANKNFGGVLGNNLLERFNQIWSFENKRLCLIPNRRMYSTNYPPQNGLLKNRVNLK